jgi:uncharacterized protein
MRCVHVLLSSVFVLWSIAAMSAESLNCRRASLADEIAICDRAQLRNLHNQMALLYVEVGKRVKDRTKFRQEQRLFISKRRACGGDSNCLRAVYDQRLTELNSMKHRTK